MPAATIDPELRHRDAELMPHGEIREQPGFETFHRAYINFQTSDRRGIQSQPVLKVNAEELPVGANAQALPFPSGLHSILQPINEYNEDIRFDAQLALSGTQQFSLTPMANRAHITLRSNWPHPEFTSAGLWNFCAGMLFVVAVLATPCVAPDEHSLGVQRRPAVPLQSAVCHFTGRGFCSADGHTSGVCAAGSADDIHPQAELV